MPFTHHVLFTYHMPFSHHTSSTVHTLFSHHTSSRPLITCHSHATHSSHAIHCAPFPIHLGFILPPFIHGTSAQNPVCIPHPFPIHFGFIRHQLGLNFQSILDSFINLGSFSNHFWIHSASIWVPIRFQKIRPVMSEWHVISG